MSNFRFKGTFDPEKFEKLKEFFKYWQGKTFALYDPSNFQMIEHPNGERSFLQKVPGLKDKENFLFHCEIYIRSQNFEELKDYPIIEFNESFDRIIIKPLEKASISRGRFYDKT